MSTQNMRRQRAIKSKALVIIGQGNGNMGRAIQTLDRKTYGIKKIIFASSTGELKLFEYASVVVYNHDPKCFDQTANFCEEHHLPMITSRAPAKGPWVGYPVILLSDEDLSRFGKLSDLAAQIRHLGVQMTVTGVTKEAPPTTLNFRDPATGLLRLTQMIMQERSRGELVKGIFHIPYFLIKA